jgi:threonine dehydratase
LLTIDDVRCAALRIAGRTVRTPLRRSEWLSSHGRADVFLKLETLQPTFSYKIRGALNAVLHLLEGDGGAIPPLVTASAGNHGRALAYAAREAGLRLTVYVPQTAPRIKLDAIRQTGAELRSCRDYDEAERCAKEHGATGTALFISPYSHPDVIAGAGTVATEILDERPDIDAFVVPIGGGGLISGIGIVAATAGALVIGVEVEASCPFTQSLSAGRIVTIDVGPTLADGLAGNMDPDTITFDLVRRHVSRIVLVGEEELKAAIGGIVREERVIAEAAAATGVAAVVSGKSAIEGRRAAVILSGANIDPEKLKALL